VCFTGQLDSEDLLLDVVGHWQRAHPEHVLRPPLPWLAAPVEPTPAPEGSGK
jgi:hypothetical protein